MNYFYYWFSLVFLIFRTCYVFMKAASINEQSKSSLLILRQCSAHNWCVELERLIYQMSTEITALSGRNLYKITRNLLFKVYHISHTFRLNCLLVSDGWDYSNIWIVFTANRQRKSCSRITTPLRLICSWTSKKSQLFSLHDIFTTTGSVKLSIFICGFMSLWN